MNARIFVAGDIVNTQHTDGEFCSADIKKIVASTDFAIGNLEAPVRGNGAPVNKSGPVLSQAAGTISGLKSIGFTAVSLANNHIMDYGREGLVKTIKELKAQDILYLGAGVSRDDAYKPLIIKSGGLRIALINACEAHYGVHDHAMNHDVSGYAWLFAPEIPVCIAECARNCDATIVLAHAGLEHFSVPLAEYRQLYRSFCRLGANAVIGSHPHVPQGVERYRDSLIAYSLGNFYFDTLRYAASADHTVSLLITISAGGKIAWEPIYSYKENGRVKLGKPHGVADITHLNEMLEQSYNAHLEAMVKKQLAVLTPVLQRSLSPWGGLTNIRATTRYWASRILKGRPATNRNILLHHLLRNESYLFAMRNAAAFRGGDGSTVPLHPR